MTTVLGDSKITTKKDVLDKLSNAPAIFHDVFDRPIASQRVAQLAVAEKHFHYFNERQYLVPQPNLERGSLSWKVATGANNSARFRTSYNIIKGDGIKYISIVGQRRYNQRAVPNNSADESNRRDAQAAYLGVRHLHREWRLQERMRIPAFHQWVSGPSYGLTEYVTDGYRWGWETEEIPQLETITEPAGWRCPNCAEKYTLPACPACRLDLPGHLFEPEVSYDVPVGFDTKTYAKGGVDLSFWSSFFVTIPFGMKEFVKVPWLSLRMLLNEWEMVKRHGDQYRGTEEWGDGEIDWATRETITNTELSESAGVSYMEDNAGKSIYERRWVTPDAFHAFTAEQRNLLRKYYRDGAEFVRWGDRLIDIQPRKLVDDWAICPTGTGELLTSDALCASIIGPQDDINALTNYMKEVVLRMIPRTFVDSSLINAEDWNNKKALIGELIRTRLPGNMDLSKLIQQLPVARFSDQATGLLTMIREMTREIGGVQPVLYGGENFDTWRQSAQARNMALMQFEPAFRMLESFGSQLSTNGLRHLAKFGTGKVEVAPARTSNFAESKTLDLSTLRTEGYHIEPVESVPMSYGEQIERTNQIATENPALAQAIGIFNPINAAQLQDMFGCETLYAEGENERESALALIEKLLQEDPIPGGIDMMTGLPLPMQPSILPDPFLHANHQVFANIIRTWCLSSTGERRAQEEPLIPYEGRMVGIRFLNVKLHGLAQQQMAMMMAMPAEPPGEGGEDPAGAPAPGLMSSGPPIEAASIGAVPPVKG